MINISESGIASLLPQSLALLVSHSRDHLRRVYPKGTRINSGNQDPAKQWRNGSHVACLNWQKYDRGTQLNEAMFVGTPGWVLKPAHMLGLGGGQKSQRMKLVGEIVGVSACKPISRPLDKRSTNGVCTCSTMSRRHTAFLLLCSSAAHAH